MRAELLRDPAIRQAYAELAKWDLAKRSFPHFLQHVTILSDDPLNPQPIPFEAWDYQLDMAEMLQAGTSIVLLKPRQAGASWEIGSAYPLWRTLYYGWACGYFSRGQDESLFQLNERIQFIYDHLPPQLRVRTKIADGVLSCKASGGWIRAFPGTESAGIGYTMQLVIADEVAFHQWGEQNYRNYQPSLSAGGQFVGMSTADPALGPHGFFKTLWDRAESGESGYTPVFWHGDIRPGRDAAWLDRERRAIGDDDVFHAFYPQSPAEAFVGRSGLALPQFATQLHVRQDHPRAWAECEYRFLAVDPGGGDPTAITPVGAYRDQRRGEWLYHQYGEFYRTGAVPLEELIGYIGMWDNLAPITAGWVDTAGGDTVRASLARYFGGRFFAADKRREAGFNTYAQVLSSRRITHHASCTHTIAEYGGLRWAVRTDPLSKERYATSTPIDNHADALSCLRYILVGATAMLEGGAAQGAGPVGIRYARAQGGPLGRRTLKEQLAWKAQRRAASDSS